MVMRSPSYTVSPWESVRATVTVMGAEPSSVTEAVTGASAPVSLAGVASAGTERVAHSSAAPEAAARARP